MNQVILVDENDNVLGQMEKMQAHIEGALHRAFSVFIFNSNNQLLLQKRSASKYHCSGLWTNTCCSHPRLNEDIHEAAKRRLIEEMGMNCDVNFVFSFLYKASLENGLFEHEFDHVFFGISDETPLPNSEEVEAFKYMNKQELQLEILSNPTSFTPWFILAFNKAIELNAL